MATQNKKNNSRISTKDITDILEENVKLALKLADKEINPIELINFKNENDNVYITTKSNIVDNTTTDNTDWEKITDEYLQTLEDRASEDISSLSISELKEKIVQQNKDFLSIYMAGIKANAKDLANVSTLNSYAFKVNDVLADLQIQEVQNIGLSEFTKLDLDKDNDNFKMYLSKVILKEIQKHLIQLKAKLHEDATDKILLSVFKQDILSLNLDSIIKIQQDEYYKNKSFYDKRHQKRERIDNLLDIIANKYKEQEQYLTTPRYRATENDDIIEKMQRQSKNIDNAKLNTSLLSSKLFNDTRLASGELKTITYPERTTKEDITTAITITDPNNKIILLNKEHQDINDKVGSLLDNGIIYITTKQLYNFINKGTLSNDYVPQENLDALLKTLSTMDKKIEIDATEQFNLKGYQKYLQDYRDKTGNTPRPVISQNLLNYKMIKNIPLPNGELIDIICFLDYPAVYDYARQYRQLAPYPAEILNLNYSPKRNTKTNTLQITNITKVIRNELIRCIELRKSGINQPIVINNFLCNNCQFYDVIDKDYIDKNKIHTKVLNKQKRIRYANNIETILNNWIDKNYIKGYTINKKGKINKYSISIKF